MIELFQRLFFGHHHKWEIIDRGQITGDGGDVIGQWFDLQCIHCGNLKRKNHTA